MPSNAAKPEAAATRQSVTAAAQSNVAKLAAAAHRALNERPGFVLNDAQIASIKQRLHLTQDQEEMWPAVEAALRNLAYTRARVGARQRRRRKCSRSLRPILTVLKCRA